MSIRILNCEDLSFFFRPSFFLILHDLRQTRFTHFDLLAKQPLFGNFALPRRIIYVKNITFKITSEEKPSELERR